jgi:hypothetical protein
MGRRGTASAVGNTTAVETDNATFWSADGTSEDGAAGSVPGSGWRWGHLRQVGEQADISQIGLQPKVFQSSGRSRYGGILARSSAAEA